MVHQCLCVVTDAILSKSPLCKMLIIQMTLWDFKSIVTAPYNCACVVWTAEWCEEISYLYDISLKHINIKAASVTWCVSGSVICLKFRVLLHKSKNVVQMKICNDRLFLWWTLKRIRVFHDSDHEVIMMAWIINVLSKSCFINAKSPSRFNMIVWQLSIVVLETSCAYLLNIAK